MGVQPYLVAATLRMSVAQRLVRRLCVHCRKPRALRAGEAAALGRSSAVGQTVYDAVGCPYCAGRGYAGRLGVYEIMVCDDEIHNLIGSKATEHRIREVALLKGMRSLRHDATDKVLAGITSVAEAIENTDGPAIRK
jgi:type IV pilus assembly protein PilB